MNRSMTIGDILETVRGTFAVLEFGQRVIIVSPYHGNSDSEHHIDTSERLEWIAEEVSELQPVMVGRLAEKELESAKRALIFDRVQDFHTLFHKPQNFSEDISYVPYAGKVYGAEEMISLVDASLDFWLTFGRYAEQFEKELEQFLGMRYALLTNSGSSANLLAISALTSPKLKERRLCPGDEVITVAAGFPTTIAPIVQNRLIPVFVDVELGTYNVLVERLEMAISAKTKAIILAHTMGNPFDVDAVLDVAKRHHLWIIEDNCDALGSLYNGKLTGSFGHLATSSFYPPHHITMGEGGAVYTNDPLLKMIVESFRDWGRDCWCQSGCDNTCGKRFGWQHGELPFGYDHKYTYSHLGYNLKPTDLQAAVGLAQLRRIQSFTARRRHNFERLKTGLRDLEDRLILPEAQGKSEPSWFGFIITVRNGAQLLRNRMVDYLQSRRIQTRMLFAGNMIRQPAFENVPHRVAGGLDNTEKIMRDTFLVGVYPGLTDDMIDYVIQEIHSAAKFAAL